MRISWECVDLVKRWEGCRLGAYKCPAGVWTIGYGHTHGVREGDRITQDEAEAILVAELDRYALAVVPLLRVDVTQGQFDALVSFAFNVGIGALARSTLLRKLNAGDHAGAASEFGRWTRAGGKVLPGLVKRREAERLLFLSA